MGKFTEKIKEEAKLDVGVVKDLSRKEKIIGAALLASAIPMVYFPLKAQDAQNKGISKDVVAEAQANIDGFDHIVSGGKDPVPVYRSSNTATVALKDGETCVVEYKTDASGSVKALFSDDSATLTDLGTCPPKDQ